jgi:DNA-binding transcriptional regulator YdaS (Cro superfamily)
MDGMTLIRAQRGLLAKVARGCNISRAAVATWPRVPAERLPEVERITGIPRQLLRPDICPPADAPDPAAVAQDAA